MVSSVSTGCLTFRDRRSSMPSLIGDKFRLKEERHRGAVPLGGIREHCRFSRVHPPSA
jgi:hypothetical protein